jgi:putative hydrolase
VIFILILLPVGHAYGTIREMAKAASEKGIELLGISEHGPGIPGTCAPVYFWNLKVVPKVFIWRRNISWL